MSKEKSQDISSQAEIAAFNEKVKKEIETLNQFKKIDFFDLKFIQYANFDTDKEGLNHYEEDIEEEEEFEIYNYSFSDKIVTQIIEELCRDRCPTRDEIQEALRKKAEDLLQNDS